MNKSDLNSIVDTFNGALSFVRAEDERLLFKDDVFKTISVELPEKLKVILDVSKKDSRNAMILVAFPILCAKLQILVKQIEAVRKKYLGYTSLVRPLVPHFDEIEDTLKNARECIARSVSMTNEDKIREFRNFRSIVSHAEDAMERMCKNRNLWEREISVHGRWSQCKIAIVSALVALALGSAASCAWSKRGMVSAFFCREKRTVIDVPLQMTNKNSFGECSSVEPVVRPSSNVTGGCDPITNSTSETSNRPRVN